MSKTQDKRQQRKEESAEYLWEQAQIKAAGFQSVLDYAVDQFNKHKDELDEKIIADTEQQILDRQEQIKTYIMTEKEKFLSRIGIQSD